MYRLIKEFRYRVFSNNLSCRCRIRYSAFVFLLLCGVILLLRQFQWTRSSIDFFTTPSLTIKSNIKLTRFLINTKFCHMPDIDPFEPSVKKFFTVSTWQPCTERYSLTYQQGLTLRLNHSLINNTYAGNFNICKVFPIRRLDKNDDSFIYLPPRIQFNNDIKIKDEFMKVECYDYKNKRIYSNFHAFVHKKFGKSDPKIERNIDKKANKTTGSTSPTTMKPDVTKLFVKNPLNIILVGIDSMSRLNFLRQMQKTYRYILKMGAIEMLGYNKVADNTFVNLVPILTGKYLEELPWNETLKDLPLDKYNFLWKVYKNRGYTTLFAEDCPPVATFNYLKFGFKQQPTDHYYRPFALAMEKETSLWSEHCFRDRSETSMVLHYTNDFARVYKDTPYFSLSFISRLTHDDINRAGIGDEDYFQFFKNLNDQQLLENTFVIFFSDHGIRFGSYRETYVGKLEERLPFMFLIPPAFFKKRFPNLLNNMKINSHRLTTPFDIYETLVDALNIDEANIKYSQARNHFPKSMKSISLFSQVPDERTCKSATILTHWCTCHQSVALKATDNKIINISRLLIIKINSLTSKYRNLCSTVELEKIIAASMIKANDEVLRFKYSQNDVIDRHVAYGDLAEKRHIDYQLTIQTTPGKGLFEATFRHYIEEETFVIVGVISRTNKYGADANCIELHKLRPYCYCAKNN